MNRLTLVKLTLGLGLIGVSQVSCDLVNVGGIAAKDRHACLAEGAAGAIVPIDGYPLSVLEDFTKKRGGTLNMRGGILTLTFKDALTEKSNVFKFEMHPASLAQTSDQCGPQSMVIERIAANGETASGLDMQDFVFSFVKNVAGELQIPTPNTVDASAALLTPRPPAIAPNPAAPALQANDQHEVTTGPAATAAASPGVDVGLSPAYQACMSSGDAANGVTVAMLDCASAETASQDARLNRAYKAKMGGLPPDQQQALRTSERDWIKSRDATCKAASDEEAGGSLAGVIYAQCVLKQEVARADQLGVAN